MTINIADNTPRVSYAVAQGVTQTSFAVSFEFFDDEDLNVYVDGTLKTLTTDYTVSGGDGSTGTVTISVTGASGGSTVVITRDIALERTTDFPASGAFQIDSLNTELDRFTAIAADLDDEATRGLRLKDQDEAVSTELPLKADRLGKVLGFNATTGVPEAGPTIADVSSLADITADIATLADIEDGTDATDAIQTVAGISSNVSTVSGISSNVPTVPGISSDVTTVAGDATDIGTVAGISSDVTSVAGISGNVTTVAGISADVTAVAGDATDIGAVAAKATEIGRLGTADAVADLAILGTADAVADMNTLGTAANVTNMDTLAGISSNITTVAGISSNVTTVAGISSNVSTVAGVSSDVTTVAGISADVSAVEDIAANVTTVAGISGNVTTVAGISSDVTTVAGDSADISTVATDIASVNTTAANITGVNSFADRYRVGASDPTTSLDEGDLAYNTTDNALKYYNGTSWASITAGLTDIVGDASPQLGGDLDLNSNDITGTGDINITGTITSDGLTVDNSVSTFNGATVNIDLMESDTTDVNTRIRQSSSGLSIQTVNDAASTATNRMRIDHTTGDISFRADDGTTDAFFFDASAQALGLGTTSPSLGSSGSGLHIKGLSNKDGTLKLDSSTANYSGVLQFTENGTDQWRIAYDATNNHLEFTESGVSDRMVIQDGGNVGIGTSSPNRVLDTRSSQQIVGTFHSSGSGSTISFVNSSTTDDDDDQIGTTSGNNMFFRTNGLERMRIDSSGNVLVGRTNAFASTATSGGGSVLNADGLIEATKNGTIAMFNRNTSNGRNVEFRQDGTIVGDVSVTGSGTTYNTTSDIRLKTDIAPIADATDKLMAMNAVTHKWKADPDADAVVGFIAQEMAEIVPEAVNKGEGEDDMWSMDYGRITPVLVAALQDAHKKIEQLEQRINEMEAE